MTARTPVVRASLDWHAARQRLALAIEGAPRTPEADLQILRDRAQRFAIAADAELQTPGLDVLCFERAGRRYAIESRLIVEVLNCGTISRVPGGRGALLGVTNLRADLLPVFDLARLFGGEPSAPSLAPQLVVLGAASPDFGILADSALEVTRLSLASLTSVSALGALPHAELVRGLTADARVLLDGAEVLRDRTVFMTQRSAGVVPERE